MEKKFFSIITLTVALGLSLQAGQAACNFWHAHTDNLQILSIERVDSTNAAVPVVVAMQR